MVYLRTSFRKLENSNTTLTERVRAGIKRQRILLSVLFLLLLIAAVYLGYYYFPLNSETGKTNKWEFIFIGFFAELANGTLGMAYGVTTSAFLISIGITPVISSAMVHISEVFNAGAAGLIHYKIGNVNKKLFRKLLVPGIIGSVAGASLLFAFKNHTHALRMAVSVYTLLLGMVIIYKALASIKTKNKIKRISLVGLLSGFLDAMGGGGWGTIVSATLIAGGRNALYTIGSVSLSKFFVALASSITFIALMGSIQWMPIAWLVVGGLVAAPIGPYLAKHIPIKFTMILVALAIILISLKQIFF